MKENRQSNQSKTINLMMISCVIAFLITGSLYFFGNTTVSTSFSLQFDGIEKGINPDNTRFEYQELIGADVVKKAFELSGKTYKEEYLSAFEVIPVLPANIIKTIETRRIAGEDYTYFPNEFIIKAHPNRSIGLDRSTCTAVITSYKTAYESYFKDHYTFPFMDLDQLISSFDYSTYDYPEYEIILNNAFNILISYLDILERDDPEYIGADQMTFNDLKEGIKLTKQLDIKKMSSLIDTYNLSNDKEQLRLKYIYMIRRYNLEKSTDLGNYEINQALLKIVEANKSTVIMPGVAGEAMTLSVVSSAYDTLAEHATDAQVSSARYVEDINYIQKQINDLDNPAHTTVDVFNAKKEVNEVATNLKIKLTTWVDRITKTANDYFEYKYQNAITSVYDVRVSRSMSPLKAIVLFFGIWVGLDVILDWTRRRVKGKVKVGFKKIGL